MGPAPDGLHARGVRVPQLLQHGALRVRGRHQARHLLPLHVWRLGGRGEQRLGALWPQVQREAEPLALRAAAGPHQALRSAGTRAAGCPGSAQGCSATLASRPRPGSVGSLLQGGALTVWGRWQPGALTQVRNIARMRCWSAAGSGPPPWASRTSLQRRAVQGQVQAALEDMRSWARCGCAAQAGCRALHPGCAHLVAALWERKSATKSSGVELSTRSTRSGRSCSSEGGSG